MAGPGLSGLSASGLAGNVLALIRFIESVQASGHPGSVIARPAATPLGVGGLGAVGGDAIIVTLGVPAFGAAGSLGQAHVLVTISRSGVQALGNAGSVLANPMSLGLGVQGLGTANGYQIFGFHGAIASPSSGVAGRGYVGGMDKQVRFALLGSSASGNAGLLRGFNVPVISGGHGRGAAGSAIALIPVQIVGVQSAGSVGLILDPVSLLLPGASAQGIAGAPAFVVQFVIPGVGAVASIGVVSPRPGDLVPVPGLAALGEIGAISAYGLLPVLHGAAAAGFAGYPLGPVGGPPDSIRMKVRANGTVKVTVQIGRRI